MSSPTYTIQDFGPADLLTSQREGFRRVRVDVAQTGFFEGREFRSFVEFSIPSGQSVVYKFSIPVNFILFEQNMTVHAGGVKYTAEVGGTFSGSFTTDLPIVGKNRMSTRPQPYCVSQASITTGGTYAGGQIIDVARLVTSGSTAQQATVGLSSTERGLPAGDYCVRLTNLSNGTSTGVYNIFWEERP